MEQITPSILASLSRLSASLGGVINPPAGGIEVLTLDLGNVVQGQLILLTAPFLMAKGATPGDTSFTIQKKSGTGTIIWEGAGDPSIQMDFPAQPALLTWSGVLVGFGIVTVSGTYVLQQVAASQGSNGTCGIGACSINAIIALR